MSAQWHTPSPAETDAAKVLVDRSLKLLVPALDDVIAAPSSSIAPDAEKVLRYVDRAVSSSCCVSSSLRTWSGSLVLSGPCSRSALELLSEIVQGASLVLGTVDGDGSATNSAGNGTSAGAHNGHSRSSSPDASSFQWTQAQYHLRVIADQASSRGGVTAAAAAASDAHSDSASLVELGTVTDSTSVVEIDSPERADADDLLEPAESVSPDTVLFSGASVPVTLNPTARFKEVRHCVRVHCCRSALIMMNRARATAPPRHPENMGGLRWRFGFGELAHMAQPLSGASAASPVDHLVYTGKWYASVLAQRSSVSFAQQTLLYPDHTAHSQGSELMVRSGDGYVHFQSATRCPTEQFRGDVQATCQGGTVAAGCVILARMLGLLFILVL